MLNKLTVGTLCSLLLICGASSAQQKNLSLRQSLGLEPSITQPLPYIAGFADDGHYITYNPKNGKQVQVSLANGTQSDYTPAKETDVWVEGRNIMYRRGSQPARKLTTDTLVKLNPTLSPDGRYAAYTQGNNLYSIEIETGRIRQYTTDGTDVIYNGYSSWVYYEEILGRKTNYKAFWWSPDSKTLAFYHFDDTHVPLYQLYGSKGHHGYIERTRYPQAGDTNPNVKVGFVPVQGGGITWADFADTPDQYFGTPYWSADSRSLSVQWMNRDQNNLIFYAVDRLTGKKRDYYNEKQSTWVDLDYDGRITFLKDNKRYILKSDRTGWSHFYLYTTGGKLITPLTSGQWQVNDIEGIDEKAGYVYFTARKEHSWNVDFYRVQLNGKNLQRLTPGNFNNAVQLSPDYKYFLNTASNVSTPPRLDLYTADGKLVRTVADSKTADFNNYSIGKTILRTINGPDGYKLPMIITYPIGFDSTKRYPIVMEIYGGPNAGTVYNSWQSVSKQFYAQNGIIQVAVDHRASGHFGKKGVSLMYRNFGKNEMRDYMAAGRWLKSQPWALPDKLLITGHSYGGYMTCMALTYGADVFDYGIAGAPVTSWDLYDSVYTERYMGTPQNNPDGYKAGSVLTYVPQYKGLLKIQHADMDDNVHLQNTIQLVDALQDNLKHFQLMIYPGGRHGWYGLKRVHDQEDRIRFYFTNLLNKPAPQEAINALSAQATAQVRH